MNDNLNKSTDVSIDSMDTNNIQSTKNNNKKIFIIFIIVFVIIGILLIVLFFTKFNKPKLLPIVTPSDDVKDEYTDNDKLEIPDDKNFKIYYTDVSSMKYINTVYNNEYFASYTELYDKNGKTLLTASDSFKNLNISNNYFYDNKNLYSLNGKLLIKNINNNNNNNNIHIDEEYIVVDRKIYYDENGKLKFDGSKYHSVQEFDGKIAIVYDESIDGYTLVDSNNKVLIKGSYDYISKFNDDLYRFQKNTKYTADFYFYSSKLNKMYGPVAYYENYDEDNMLVDIYNGNSEDRKAYVEDDKLSTFILNLNDFSTKSLNKMHAYEFSDTVFNGKYLVNSYFGSEGFKRILYDVNFNKISDVKYDEITNVNNEYAILTLGSKQTVVNKDLKELFSFEYDETHFLEDSISYDDNLFIASNDDNSYMFDKNGKSIYNSPTKLYVDYSYKNYYFIEEYGNEYDKCLYLNINEDKKVKEVDYSFCDNSFDAINQFILMEKNNKFLLYDVSLNPVSNETYDYLELFDNYYLAINNDEIYVMSYTGNKLLEDKFVDYELINRVIKHNVIDKDDALILEKEDGSKFYFNYE